MAATITGLDQYSASPRTVTIGLAGALVLLEVEATSGSSTGHALLTPDQARALADGLQQQAQFAADAAELSGTFDRRERS